MLTLPGNSPEITIEERTIGDFLWERVRQERSNLFAIIDSEKKEEVLRMFITSNVLYKSLFEGTIDERYWGESGFLVDCSSDASFFHWLTTNAWGESCCIYFASRVPFEKLFRHFQKFNRVYLEDDDVVYFRFYDPRVLRVYLPTCNKKEIETFFGDVDGFFLEDEDPRIIITFSRNQTPANEVLLTKKYRLKN